MTEKSKKTEFADILSHGVDFKNRRVYFGYDSDDEFTWSTVEVVIKALQKMASDYIHMPIELHMSSSGGQVDEMLRLYDAIQSNPCQVKFYGSGKIMSAAVWIMACCDERYLTPNTQVMVHKWHSGIDVKTETDMKIEFEHYSGWLTSRLNEILAENSKLPEEFWEEVTKRDLFLTPDECIMLGIADFIVPFKRRGNLRKKRVTQMNKNVDKIEMKKLISDIHKRTHRGKNLKIELNIPDEKFDKDIYVDSNIQLPSKHSINDADY